MKTKIEWHCYCYLISFLGVKRQCGRVDSSIGSGVRLHGLHTSPSVWQVCELGTTSGNNKRSLSFVVTRIWMQLKCLKKCGSRCSLKLIIVSLLPGLLLDIKYARDFLICIKVIISHRILVYWGGVIQNNQYVLF